jgi:hypothetical protein
MAVALIVFYQADSSMGCFWVSEFSTDNGDKAFFFTGLDKRPHSAQIIHISQGQGFVSKGFGMPA